MKVKDAILQLQALLLVPEDKRFPKVGPMTRARLDRLAALDPEAEWEAEVEALVNENPSGGRNINEAGLALVKHFESLYLDAYPDSVGVWTIGWGHTGLQHEDGTVYPGRKISEAKAAELLRYDMDQFEARVSSFVKVPLSDNEFAALVAFDFNTGGLGKSTLLKKLNAGDKMGAANEFLKWDKATVNGKRVTLKGLTRRRMSERNLFLSRSPAIVSLDDMRHYNFA